jgi:hypothetical protein
MQLDLTVLTKRKETICYCESFGYSGKYTLNKCFYHSNGVSAPAENGSNILIISFSLTSPYNGLFTNKFLHVSINNKIISINRNEAYRVPNSSTKATKQQNKVINNKISRTLSKTTTYLR